MKKPVGLTRQDGKWRWFCGSAADLWLGMSWWCTLWQTHMWAWWLTQAVQQLNAQQVKSQPNMTSWYKQAACFNQSWKLLSALNESSVTFLFELGRKIASVSGDSRETSFLFQHISFSIQLFHSVLLHGSFTGDNEWPLQFCIWTFRF